MDHSSRRPALTLCSFLATSTMALAATLGVAVPDTIKDNGEHPAAHDRWPAATQWRPLVATDARKRMNDSAVEECAQPLALAAGDLDEDGVPDLVVGCGDEAGNGVLIRFHGRAEAIYRVAGSKETAPFAGPTIASRLAARAEWVAVADLDADGHDDVVVVTFGSSRVQLLRGDGRGSLASPRTIALPGAVLAATVGELGRRDGLAELVIAVTHEDASMLVVLEAQRSGGPVQGASTPIPGTVTGLATVRLGDDAAHGIAVATDLGLLLVHAPDVPGAVAGSSLLVSQGTVHDSLVAVAVGDFVASGADQLEIAVLAEDGVLCLLERCDDCAQPPTPDRHLSWKVAAQRQVIEPAVASRATGRPGLVGARAWGSPGQELVVLDPRHRQLAAVKAAGHGGVEKAAASTLAPTSLHLDTLPNRAADSLPRPGSSAAKEQQLPQLGASRSLLEEVAPVAVLSMRLNADALDDLVLLLEDQSLPQVALSVAQAAFPVTSTADTDDGTCDADCTLREAIAAANLSPGADLISFAIDGSPPYVISLTSELPEITEAVTIDGTTQPEYAGTPVVVLDGAGVTAGSFGGGLLLSGGSSTVRGLACNGFTLNSCITVWGGDGNIIEGNFLGTDASGTVAVGTLAGTNAVASSDNTFGGTTAAARNVIAAVSAPAIELREGANNNTIQGNYIGLDVSGTTALPNDGTDLVIWDSESNTLGGATAAERNVVTGGTDPSYISIGIATSDTDPATNAQDNLIQGNYIGTDATGNVGMGTASAAVYILDAPSNTVGGATGNVIVDAGLWGVAAVSAGALGNLVSNNLIGVGADGETPLGNASDGVHLYIDASGTMITNNTIANNGENGIGLRDTSGSGNMISANSIFANTLLGIDLDRDGVTANDLQDPDTGANALQNYPELTSFDLATNTVSGSLGSMADATFTIELFASSACDDSGYGEGEQLVGSTTVTTDGSGDATFVITTTQELSGLQVLTATATDAASNTSELSACLHLPLFTDGFESGDPSQWSATVSP